jgi:hypothetical protein
MNYQKAYMNLVLNRQSLPDRRPEIYCEVHHIIPKCLGGKNSKDNLVILTAKEHYMAHLLLTKMYEGKAKTKMIYSLWLMCKWDKTGNHNISAARYAYARELFISTQRGAKYSPERCKNISESLKGKPTHNKGGTSWAKGVKYTETHRRKMSDARKRQPPPTLGKKHSDETRLIMKEKAKIVWMHRKMNKLMDCQ